MNVTWADPTFWLLKDLPFVLAILFTVAFFAVAWILISRRKENNHSQFSGESVKAQRLETSESQRRELGDVSERNTCQGRRENKSATND